MAQRYISTEITQNSQGRRYYKTTLYPKIEPSESDYYIYSSEEDRLDLLAQTYYGDSTLWWIISTANNVPHDGLFVPPGTQLRIPTNVSFILEEFRTLNQNR